MTDLQIGLSLGLVLGLTLPRFIRGLWSLYRLSKKPRIGMGDERRRQWM